MPEKSLNEKQSSFLIQPLVIIATYAMTVVCAYFRLYSFVFWLLSAFIFTVAFFWGKSALKKIEISSFGKTIYCYPGSRINIDFTIRNKKFIPLI